MPLKSRIERLETASTEAAPKVECVFGEPGEASEDAVRRHFGGPPPEDTHLLILTISAHSEQTPTTKDA